MEKTDKEESARTEACGSLISAENLIELLHSVKMDLRKRKFDPAISGCTTHIRASFWVYSKMTENLTGQELEIL